MRFLIICLLSTLLFSCGPSLNKILKSKDAAYKLKMADQFYAKKKYTKAQQVYEDIIPYYKTTPQFEDLYYKYAYASYNDKDYTVAETHFKTFMESFPNSPKAEEMEYMLAYIYYLQSPKAELDQSNTYKAIGGMQTFINTHPNSVRLKDANHIVDELRKKLEDKEFKSANLYYNLGQYRAAQVSFTTLLENFPETSSGDLYKYLSVKSYYKFAENSLEEKKIERFNEVIQFAKEFLDRFPESKFKTEIENYIQLSNTQINKLNNTYSNEQTKKTT